MEFREIRNQFYHGFQVHWEYSIKSTIKKDLLWMDHKRINLKQRCNLTRMHSSRMCTVRLFTNGRGPSLHPLSQKPQLRMAPLLRMAPPMLRTAPPLCEHNDRLRVVTINTGKFPMSTSVQHCDNTNTEMTHSISGSHGTVAAPIKIVTDTLIGSNVMQTWRTRHFITIIHSARLCGLDLIYVVIAMWLTSDAVYQVRNIPYVILWGF